MKQPTSETARCVFIFQIHGDNYKPTAGHFAQRQDHEHIHKISVKHFFIEHFSHLG
jgi:hypothetical protein